MLPSIVKIDKKLFMTIRIKWWKAYQWADQLIEMNVMEAEAVSNDEADGATKEHHATNAEVNED